MTSGLVQYTEPEELRDRPGGMGEEYWFTGKDYSVPRSRGPEMSMNLSSYLLISR